MDGRADKWADWPNLGRVGWWIGRWTYFRMAGLMDIFQDGQADGCTLGRNSGSDWHTLELSYFRTDGLTDVLQDERTDGRTSGGWTYGRMNLGDWLLDELQGLLLFCFMTLGIWNLQHVKWTWKSSVFVELQLIEICRWLCYLVLKYMKILKMDGMSELERALYLLNCIWLRSVDGCATWCWNTWKPSSKCEKETLPLRSKYVMIDALTWKVFSEMLLQWVIVEFDFVSFLKAGNCKRLLFNGISG